MMSKGGQGSRTGKKCPWMSSVVQELHSVCYLLKAVKLMYRITEEAANGSFCPLSLPSPSLISPPCGTHLSWSLLSAPDLVHLWFPAVLLSHVLPGDLVLALAVLISVW
jgi:hypothetical protein